jgi:uncharacterized protein YqhQ
LALVKSYRSREDVLVDDVAVLAILADADASASLPQLGGMARPDGVAIVSERFWSFSRVGEAAVLVRQMPLTTVRLTRLPFVRGLVKLGAALVPLLGRRAAASRKERLLLLSALIAPLLVLAVPSGYRTPALVAITVGLICWMFRGRTLNLHGAEHRAIAAAEARALMTTWHGMSRPSRFSPRCGTNFAVLLIAISMLLDRVFVLRTAALAPVVVTLLSLMITTEIWLVAQRSEGRFGRLLLLPGLFLQRLTTREPTIEETRVALRAVAAVLAADAEHRSP